MAWVEASAGGEAVERWPAGVELHRQVRDRHRRLLLDLAHGSEGFEGEITPDFCVEGRSAGGPGGECIVGEVAEIEAAFAAAGVGADVVGVHFCLVEAGHFPGLGGGVECKLGVAAGLLVKLIGGADGFAEVEIFDFGGEGGGEGGGVEEGGGGDARLAGEEAASRRFRCRGQAG